MADAIEDRQVMLATISGRRSVRAFLDRPVPRGKIEAMLAIASRAPSGSNNQPWRVHVLGGQAKARFSTAILAERASGAPEPALEYRYYRTIGRSPISAVAARWVGRFTGAFELISTRLWLPNSRVREIVRHFRCCGDRDGANRRTLYLDEG